METLYCKYRRSYIEYLIRYQDFHNVIFNFAAANDNKILLHNLGNQICRATDIKQFVQYFKNSQRYRQYRELIDNLWKILYHTAFFRKHLTFSSLYRRFLLQLSWYSTVLFIKIDLQSWLLKNITEIFGLFIMHS